MTVADTPARLAKLARGPGDVREAGNVGVLETEEADAFAVRDGARRAGAGLTMRYEEALARSTPASPSTCRARRSTASACSASCSTIRS